jgi:prepilin-type N-terminal cleavage/methylation domain-containing protein
MRSTKPHRRAFTLVEILVVISIFVLLLAIAVPAFSSMLYSSEQSLAESAVRIALNTARDVAARSPTGQDSAAVFTYEIASKKMSILITTQVGTLDDQQDLGAGPVPITRDVFAPAPGIEPLQMTSGWAVRGYAPANSIDNEWYELTYVGNTVRQRGNWLFPETSLNDEDIQNSGNNRQTFMVRFEGGTGQVKGADPRAVLVFSESPSTTGRNTWPPPPNGYGALNNPLNPDNETDAVRFCRRILAWPLNPPTPTGISLLTKRKILGQVSRDVILAKSVGQIAVYSENRLARAIGARTDQATGCLYVNPTTTNFQPQFVAGVQSDTINAWIENRLLDTNNDKIDSDSRVFSVQRYLGWLQEVTGTGTGEGVGS